MDPIIARIRSTLAEAGGRFPYTADARTGQWQWADDGGWVGGFWPALLRLAARRTGDDTLADAAREAAADLAPRCSAPTLLRGFLFWYGDAVGAELGTGPMSEAAHTAARELAADLDRTAGVIPPGQEDAELYEWPRPGACIDGLPGTVPLLHAHGADEAAATHADGSARFCIRPDGSASQDATYDASGVLTEQVAVNGVRPDSTWSRAQAWAMLGFAQAAVRDERFRPVADAVSDWWCAHVPADRVAFWDFDDPAITDPDESDPPRDTSATAIAAAALLKLGRRADAAATRDALAEHLGPSGGLVDGCLNRKKRIAVGDELVWGDYFLLETDLGLAHGLDTTRL